MRRERLEIRDGEFLEGELGRGQQLALLDEGRAFEEPPLPLGKNVVGREGGLQRTVELVACEPVLFLTVFAAVGHEAALVLARHCQLVARLEAVRVRTPARRLRTPFPLFESLAHLFESLFNFNLLSRL